MNSVDIVFQNSQKAKKITNYLFVRRAIRKPQRIVKSIDKQLPAKSQLQKQAALFSDFIIKTKIHANINKDQVRYSNTPTSVLSHRLKIKLSPQKIYNRNSINTSHPNGKHQYENDSNFDQLITNLNRSYEVNTARYQQRQNLRQFLDKRQIVQESLDLQPYNVKFNAAYKIKQRMGQQIKVHRRSFKIFQNKSPKRFIQGLRILPSLSKKLQYRMQQKL